MMDISEAQLVEFPSETKEEPLAKNVPSVPVIDLLKT